MMTTVELRTAAEEFWERFNAHDVSDSDERIAPGFVNHNAAPGTPEGLEGLRQVAARLYEAFPDMRFEVEEVFTTEDRVAVLGWMNGTQEGQFGPFIQPRTATRSSVVKTSSTSKRISGKASYSRAATWRRPSGPSGVPGGVHCDSRSLGQSVRRSPTRRER